MSDPRQRPGWSLDQPFSYRDAAADLHAAIRAAAALARTDDGTAAHNAEVQRVQAVIERLKARLRRHAQP